MQQTTHKPALDPDSAIAMHKFKVPLKNRVRYKLSAIFEDADVCKYGAAWWACIAVLSVVAAGVIVAAS